MASADTKALVERFAAEFWDRGNAGVVDELFAPDWATHNPGPGVPPNRDGLKQLRAGFGMAFSNIHTTVDDLVAEGDKVAWRWTFHGTHTGEFMGMPASGKAVTLTGISLDRLTDGKFVERWDEVDSLGLLQQLGAMPSPG